MKRLALIIPIASLALGAFAGQAKPKKPQPKPKTEVACPIMPDHKVSIAKATKEGMFADHKGRRYFFCCAGCKPAFAKNPDKYAKAESIPTPKKKA
ncbi:MAG TPA: YHS domain-containing protein [Fimbriimonadaceae bacterium]|nr:YHS domain-containing protein [Fimbriimonadaceae bacterium]